jgi:hypothetical protein
MPGLRPLTWLKARALYESGASIMAISRKYRVSPNAVRRHRIKEGWALSAQAAEEMVRIPEATQRQISLAARGRVVEEAVSKAVEAQEPSAVKAAGSALTALLEESIPLARRTLEFAKNAIEFSESLLASAMKNPTQSLPPREGWSSFCSATVSTSANAIGLIRECAGMKSGTPTIPLDRQARVIYRHNIVTTDNPKWKSLVKSGTTAHTSIKDKG